MNQELLCRNCGHPIYKVRYIDPITYEHFYTNYFPLGLPYTTIECPVAGCDCSEPKLGTIRGRTKLEDFPVNSKIENIGSVE